MVWRQKIKILNATVVLRMGRALASNSPCGAYAAYGSGLSEAAAAHPEFGRMVRWSRQQLAGGASLFNLCAAALSPPTVTHRSLSKRFGDSGLDLNDIVGRINVARVLMQSKPLGLYNYS